MRRRRAAVTILLASVLLLLLGSPAPGTPPSPAAVGPAPAVQAHAVPQDAVPEGAGTSCPSEQDPALRRAGARSPRTAPAAGTRHATDGTHEDAPAARRPAPRTPPAGTPPRPASGEAARDAAVLRTFRC
ncbi:hypothetical protein [Streptomyces sp. NPDC052012]|uniref:hypothetical protein n=1 Tax=Streptomyces sp. NPDC052012 TaxID=3155051 RepID=UPI00344B4A0B